MPLAHTALETFFGGVTNAPAGPITIYEGQWMYLRAFCPLEYMPLPLPFLAWEWFTFT